ncbi:PASTA domain-containing protein, partial [Blastococcus sp. TF02A-35]|uniref:PASTA domain-containing protein n=1 Tax=Blastococcus sp. TF02A-35 TaxID=2559612 RepID=UPI001FD82F56
SVLPVPGPGAAPPTAVQPAAATRPRRRWLVPALAVAAALVLAVAVLTTLLPSGARSPSPGSTPSSTTPAGIEVVAADHVGRPVRDVQADLIGLGLRVEPVPVEAADVAAGQVTAVEPSGTLAPGDLVRLTYAVPPVVVPAPVEQPGDGQGEGGQQDEKAEERQKKKEEEQRKKEEERQKKAEEEQEENEEEGGD